MSKGAPQNSIIGGATLWVLRDRPRAEYKGVARFFAYPVAARRTGGLAPEHRLSARDPRRLRADARAGFLRAQSRALRSRSSRSRCSRRRRTRSGIRLGSFVLIRGAIEDELEQVFRRQEVRAGRARCRGRARQQAAAPVRARQSGSLSCAGTARAQGRPDSDGSAGTSQMTRVFAPGAPTPRDGCRSRSTSPAATASCSDAACVCHRHQSRRRPRRQLILKIFPPLLRAQFVSERGSLRAACRTASASDPRDRRGRRARRLALSRHHAPCRRARLGGVAAAAGSAEGARAAPDRRDHRAGAARAARRAR